MLSYAPATTLPLSYETGDGACTEGGHNDAAVLGSEADGLVGRHQRLGETHSPPPEDGHRAFLRNAGIYVRVHTASQPRKITVVMINAYKILFRKPGCMGEYLSRLARTGSGGDCCKHGQEGTKCDLKTDTATGKHGDQ
jgi:hypothetical protein